MTITDFLHTIKARVDELALLGSPMDIEDVTDIIFAGLGDDYKELARSIQAQEKPISFEELHEKLLTFEVSTTKIEPIHFLATSNLATKPNNHSSSNYRNQNYNNSLNYQNNRNITNKNNN